MPDINTMDMGTIAQFAAGCRFAERFDTLEAYLHARMYSTLDTSAVHEEISVISDEDLDIMIKSGVFKHLPRKSARGLARIFAVPESAKNRRRSILWPKWLNSNLPRIPFSSEIHDVADKWHTPLGGKSRTFDLKASFYQIPLDADVSPFYAARVRSSSGRTHLIAPTRAPMGAHWVPELMHCIVQVLAADIKVPEVYIYIHVDNIRFTSVNAAACDQAAEMFKERCAAANVTLKEEPSDIFLGAKLNHCDGTVSCTPVTLEKLARSAVNTLDSPQCSLGSLREFVSRLCWSSRILRIPLAEFYPSLKFIRRRFSAAHTSGDDDSTLTTIWPSVLSNFRAWHDRIQQNQACSHPLPDVSSENRFTLICDASLSGYGALLIDNKGNVQSFAGKWSGSHSSGDMAQLEMLAISLAAQHWSSELSYASHIDLLTDNSSCEHTLKKGSAYSFTLNAALRTALFSLPREASICVGFIRSDLNPADAISRGRLFTAAASAAARNVAASLPAGGLKGCWGPRAQVRVAGCTPNE